MQVHGSGLSHVPPADEGMLLSEVGSQATSTSDRVPDAVTQLLLIRHAKASGPRSGCYWGRTNVPLTATGVEEAKNLAHYLVKHYPDISAIYSSTLDRAITTAQATANLFNLNVTQKADLVEMDWGAAEGVPTKEVDERWGPAQKELLKTCPDRRKRWDHPIFPEAETYNALLQRTTKDLREIATAHPGEQVAVFAHGRVIRTLVRESLDSEDFPSLVNCEIAHVRFNPEDSVHPFTFVRREKPSE